MMLKALVGVLLMAVSLSAIAASTGRLDVSVEGRVAHPGIHSLPVAAHLSDAVVSAGVSPDAYVLGAAWLQKDLQMPQRRLKAGVQFELQGVVRLAAGRKDTTLATAARRLQAELRAMPVTGRRVPPTLDPDELQLVDAINLGVASGDRLIYPRRPVTVRVIGAVQKPCTLPQAGSRDARDYLKDCPVSAAADPDIVYLIQPDGRVFERGRALWNRSPPMPLAPGAMLYVPLDRHDIQDAVDARFNRDVADFLATQPIGTDGVTP